MSVALAEKAAQEANARKQREELLKSTSGGTLFAPAHTPINPPKPSGQLPTVPAQPALQQAINQMNGGGKGSSPAPGAAPAVNLANEQKYLESILAQGGGGATWALNQAKSYGITLNQPTAQPTAGGGGGAVAPKVAPTTTSGGGGGGVPAPTPSPGPGTGDPAADMSWLAAWNAERKGEGGEAGAKDPTDPAYISDLATGIFNELNQMVANASAEGQKYLAQAMNGFMTALDTAQGQMMSTFQEQMNGVDPATKAALDQIKESAQQYRKTMMEDLNRRGLLQSGIAVESDIQLNKNQLTAEQQLLAQRVSDLQNRMTSAMMQFTQSRLQALQQYGLTGVEMASKAGDQQLSAFQAAMNQAMGQANLQQGANQFNKTFEEGKNQFNQNLSENQRQFDEKMAMSKEEAEQSAKQFMAQMGYNWANLSAKQKQDAIDNEFKKQEMQLKQDGASGTSSGETQRAIMLMQEYGSQEEAMVNFQRPEVIQEMVKRGVNVNEVYAAILKMKSGGATPGSSFMPK